MSLNHVVLNLTNKSRYIDAGFNNLEVLGNLTVGGNITYTGTTIFNNNINMNNHLINNLAPGVVSSDAVNLGQVESLINTGLNSITSTIGQPNGIASLNAQGVVPNSQLPSYFGNLNYIGTWNASTNTPALNIPPSGTGQANGDYYIVSVAGIFDNISWQIGDTIVSNGITWQKLAGSQVQSVFNRVGAVVAENGDYNAGQITYTNNSQTTAGGGLDTLFNDVSNINSTITGLNSVYLELNGSNTMTGALNMNLHNITGALDVSSSGCSSLNSLQSNFNSLQNKVNTLDATEVSFNIKSNVSTALNTLFDDITAINSTITGLSSVYLELNGSNTMTGALNMNLHNITGALDVSSSGCSSLNALYNQVQNIGSQTGLSNIYLELNGSNTMTGALNMNLHNITGALDVSSSGCSSLNALYNQVQNSVVSVFGRSGVVVADNGDYNASQITYTNNSETTVNGGLDTLFNDISNINSDLEGLSTTYLKLDGSNSMGSSLNMNNNKLVNVANGTSNSDAVNLGQVIPVITNNINNTILPGFNVAGSQSINQTQYNTGLVPQNCLYMYNSDNLNGFLITTDFTNNWFLYTLINGTWAYAGSASISINNNTVCECVGKDGIIIFLESDNVSNYQLKYYIYDPNSFILSNLGGVGTWTGGTNTNAPAGLCFNGTNTNGYLLSFYLQSNIQSYSYVSNFSLNPAQAVNAPNINRGCCVQYSLNNNSLLYGYNSGTTYEIYEASVIGLSPSTFSSVLSIGTTLPDGNTTNVISNCYLKIDDNSSAPYMHVFFPNCGIISGPSNSGAMLSYVNLSGVWTYGNILYGGSYGSLWCSDDPSSVLRYQGYMAFISSSNIYPSYLMSQEYGTGKGFLYSFSYSPSAPYITYNNIQSLIWNHQPTNNNVYPPCGGFWFAGFDNYLSNYGLSTIKFFPLLLGGTTTTTYLETYNPVQINNNLIVNGTTKLQGLVQLPQLTGAEITAQGPAVPSGSFVINTTTNQLMLFYGNSWNVLTDLIGNN